MQPDIRQHRAFKIGKKPAHLLVHFFGGADIGKGAASCARRAFHEVRIRRRTDPDREQPALAYSTADVIKECAFVAHGTVCDENDLTHPFAGRRAVQSKGQRRKHFCAPLGFKAFDVGDGFRDVFRGSRQRPSEKLARARRKGDHIKGVGRTQAP